MLPGFTAAAGLLDAAPPTRRYAPRSRARDAGRIGPTYLLPQARIMDESGPVRAPGGDPGGADAQTCTCPCCITKDGVLRCC